LGSPPKKRFGRIKVDKAVGSADGTTDGTNVVGLKVGDVEGILREQEAHTFKDLRVPTQGSRPKKTAVAETLQEFNPTHFETIVAVVVFKAQLEVANDPQSFPDGVPYDAKGIPEM
jgi:hypothetical protein